MKRLLSLIALVVTICGTMTAQNASGDSQAPTDRIWYTSADGAIIELYIDLYDFGVSTFGARIMSFSEYDEERGMYYFQFNGPVTKIGAGAFRGITELTSIIIPDGVTIIENEAFKECTALTSAIIGNGVRSIGTEAFESCTSLTSAIIGNGVRSIGTEAFESCTSLTSITIPDNVESIGTAAFRGDTDLTSIIIPDGVTGIADETFKGCTALKSAIIGNGVRSIGTEAFESCTSLTSITIPDNVESIGTAAFGGCHSLALVTIGKGIKEINASAFMECNDLGIHVIFTSPEPPVLEIGAFFFIGWSEFDTDFEYDVLEGFKRVIVPNEDYLQEESEDDWNNSWPAYSYTILVDPLTEGLDDIKDIAIQEIGSIDVTALGEASLKCLADYKTKIEQAETALEVFSLESEYLKTIARTLKDYGYSNVPAVKDKHDATVTYNLHGQRVSDDYNGLIIRDGKKYLNR